MDVTTKTKIALIARAQNKKHWRVREHVRDVNTEIGMYRLTSLKNRGTKLSMFCNRKANEIERELELALSA